MSIRYADFQGEIALIAKQNWQYATAANPVPPAALNAELQAVSTALAGDTRTHGHTIEKAPAGLQNTIPTFVAPFTRLTNAINLQVNKGLAGNLPAASMIAAIDGVIGVLFAPGNVDVPYCSGNPVHGNVLTVTQGNWVGTPTSYAYQWKSNGVNVGTSVATYTTVVGDVGHSVGCVVSATNATGTTAAPLSNTVLVS